MTFWEFDCAVRGWMRGQGHAEKRGPPTPEEFYAAVTRH